MAKMAELYAALTELPDSVKEEMERQENFEKNDFMQGFHTGRAEGIAIGQEEGAFLEQERIIKLLEKTVDVYLSDKLLVEAAIVANNIALIKGESNADISAI